MCTAFIIIIIAFKCSRRLCLFSIRDHKGTHSDLYECLGSILLDCCVRVCEVRLMGLFLVRVSVFPTRLIFFFYM